MSERVTTNIEQRRTGYVAMVFVDGLRVYKQTCATEQQAREWCEVKAEEVRKEVRTACLR